MKVVTVVGARPQFIKAASVSRVLRRQQEEVLVHTGQHYDDNMSSVFFRELDLPEPNYQLGVGSGLHGQQTGRMLEYIEDVLLKEKPNWVLIYGDTNSTLAGALAAVKLHIKVAHVEAGLRSFNRRMPEEINRIVSDTISNLLFCPSQTAADNLAREGIVQGVHVVGDVMLDALDFASRRAIQTSDVLLRLGLKTRSYLLATVHRAENTDDPDRLRNILSAFNGIDEMIIFPVHPRTRKVISLLHDLKLDSQVHLIEPVGYIDMVMLEQSARMILTDSGGMQKEAYWLSIPCVTMRDETEWVETVNTGWNVLVGADKQRIIEAVRSGVYPEEHPELYGNSGSAQNIVSHLV